MSNCVGMASDGPKPIRILHASTAHPPTDPRIIFRQCATLSSTYDVWCALPKADAEVLPAIRFVRLPYFRRVLWRAFFTMPLVAWHTYRLRPALLHIYSPELLPLALIAKVFGIRFIYEVQENLFLKFPTKTINRHGLLRRLFRFFDGLARRHGYLVFTEHAYLETYRPLAKPHEVIYNYPNLPDFEPFLSPYSPNSAVPVFFYIGLISHARALDTLIAAIALLKPQWPHLHVHLFGNCLLSKPQLNALPHFEEVAAMVTFHGYTSHSRALSYAKGATAGLALLKPVGDYPDSYPTKLFEYMALGLPVITSDFPLYQSVVQAHQCGLCINPNNPNALAGAMRFLIQNPNAAADMGQRGQAAVRESYTWQTEAQKLLAFYRNVLQQ